MSGKARADARRSLHQMQVAHMAAVEGVLAGDPLGGLKVAAAKTKRGVNDAAAKRRREDKAEDARVAKAQRRTRHEHKAAKRAAQLAAGIRKDKRTFSNRTAARAADRRRRHPVPIRPAMRPARVSFAPAAQDGGRGGGRGRGGRFGGRVAERGRKTFSPADADGRGGSKFIWRSSAERAHG